MTKSIHALADLTPDPRNANKGTERGLRFIEDSLRNYGAGRSILADRNGVILAGNKTLESAASMGIPVKVVQTNGQELVVVQRSDLDLASDPKARELAYADNRAGQVSLDWDADQIAQDIDDGIDLSKFWNEGEIAVLLDAVNETDLPELPSGDGSGFQQMTFTLTDEQVETVQAAVKKAKHDGNAVDAVNENSNGNALAYLAGAYLGQG